MNKDELIQLRKELLAGKGKKYTDVFIGGTTDYGIYVDPSEEEKTREEIFGEYTASEIMAVKYFETKLEEIIRNATTKNVDFDGISSPMFLRFFITKEMADKIDNTCHLQPELFDKNNVLKQFVEVTFNYDFIGNTDDAAENYMKNVRETTDMRFLIDYEKFVNYLIERGFDVSITTFEDALSSALKDVQPTITADLTKETKRSK